MRRLQDEGHHSALRQLCELGFLHVLRGVGPALYLRAGLYRRAMPWREKISYLGLGRYERIIHSINPAEYDHIARNKLEAYRVFTANGIPTPLVYGVVEGADVPDWKGETLRSPDELLAVLERHGTDKVCFKYIAGTRGRGFYKGRVDAASGDITLQPSGERLPLRELWDRLRSDQLFKGYFCQAVIDQHPDVARLNPWSVNTARTWVARDRSGAWRMIVSVLRIGNGESAVDNISAGGFGVPLDVSTGRLSAATSPFLDRTVYPQHPVTGAQIEGTVVPTWTQARELCERTAALFPFYLLVSVDVAFTTNGPVVIEIGTTPDNSQGETERGAYYVLRSLKKHGYVDGPVG